MNRYEACGRAPHDLYTLLAIAYHTNDPATMWNAATCILSLARLEDGDKDEVLFDLACAVRELAVVLQANRDEFEDDEEDEE